MTLTAVGSTFSAQTSFTPSTTGDEVPEGWISTIAIAATAQPIEPDGWIPTANDSYIVDGVNWRLRIYQRECGTGEDGTAAITFFSGAAADGCAIVCKPAPPPVTENAGSEEYATPDSSETLDLITVGGSEFLVITFDLAPTSISGGGPDVDDPGWESLLTPVGRASDPGGGTGPGVTLSAWRRGSGDPPSTTWSHSDDKLVRNITHAEFGRSGGWTLGRVGWG